VRAGFRVRGDAKNCEKAGSWANKDAWREPAKKHIEIILFINSLFLLKLLFPRDI
jgi:hypothetical protein